MSANSDIQVKLKEKNLFKRFNNALKGIGASFQRIQPDECRDFHCAMIEVNNRNNTYILYIYNLHYACIDK